MEALCVHNLADFGWGSVVSCWTVSDSRAKWSWFVLSAQLFTHRPWSLSDLALAASSRGTGLFASEQCDTPVNWIADVYLESLGSLTGWRPRRCCWRKSWDASVTINTCFMAGALQSWSFSSDADCIKNSRFCLKWPWREVLNFSRRVTYSGWWEIEAIMSGRAIPEAIWLPLRKQSLRPSGTQGLQVRRPPHSISFCPCYCLTLLPFNIVWWPRRCDRNDIEEDDKTRKLSWKNLLFMSK